MSGSFEKAKSGASKAAGCCGSQLKGLREFLIVGNFIDVALAFVIGGAFKTLIDAFVASFITPLFGAIGGTSFKDLCFSVNNSKFCYGLFIDALISFLMIILCVYFMIVVPVMAIIARYYPNRIYIRDCPECLSPDVPAAATRCLHCGCSVTKLINNPAPQDNAALKAEFEDALDSAPVPAAGGGPGTGVAPAAVAAAGAATVV